MKKNYFIFILTAVCLAFSISYQWYTFEDTKYEGVIDSDGKGYYAFLPAVFIYHDLSFQFFFKKENSNIKRYFHERFLVKQGSRTILKTYSGEAILLLPFFTAGCLLQYACNGEVNGYEPLLQFFICLAALFYMAMGLFYLRKFLRYYYVEERIIVFTFLAFVFGTNLFYYAVFHPSMTHVYSFSLIAMFLFFARSFLETENKKPFWTAAFILGLIVLVRPVNICVLLILPFLRKEKGIGFYIAHFRKKGLLWVGALSIFLGLLSVQLALNYFQCGQLFVWSYGDEGFKFLHPHFFSVFFSFRNGLLIYSPLLVLALIGLWTVFRKERTLFYGLILIFSVTYYLISSWWCWYYGGGFGHRASIDWYAFFIIPFAFLFQNVHRLHERILKIVGVLLIFLNLFQTWQYLRGIIHPEGMSYEKYAYVFLHSSPDYYRCIGDGVEETYLPRMEIPFLATQNNFEQNPEGWEIRPVTSWNSDTVALLNDTIEYGPTLVMQIHAPEFFRPYFLRVTLDRYENEFKACTHSLVMVDYVTPEGKIYDSKNLRINDLPRTELFQWKNFEYDFPLPPIKHQGDILKVFIWNLDRKSFYIDHMKAEFFSYQQLAKW